MTEEEITATKLRIREALSERMEKAFVGQSMADVSAALVRGYVEGVLKDLQNRGDFPRVTELIDWDVRFVGNTMHVVMEPKKGLDDHDYRRAVNFLFNQGDD